MVEEVRKGTLPGERDDKMQTRAQYLSERTAVRLVGRKGQEYNMRDCSSETEGEGQHEARRNDDAYIQRLPSEDGENTKCQSNL